MPPLLLTRQGIADALSMPEKQARAILAAHGVQPIDLGKGRGHGLRWRTSAVIAVADALHAEAQRQKGRPHRTRKLSPLKGRTAADLYAEFQTLNGGAAPVQ